MRIFKRTVLFLLALVLMTGCLHFSLRNPSEIQVKYRDFLNGDYHQVVLGHSMCRDGIDPRYLSDQPVYNLGCPAALPLIPSLLEELDRQKGVEKVYLELSYPYFLEKIYHRSGNMLYDETLSRMMAKHRPLRFLELMGRENLFAALFNYTFSPEGVARIPENVRLKSGKAYRTGDPAVLKDVIWDSEFTEFAQGYAARTRILEGGGSSHVFSPEAVAPQALEDFRYLAQYCRDRGIELVAYATALPPERLKTEDFGEIHDFYQSLCDEQNVTFYDLNYLKWEYFPRTSEFYRDESGHGLPVFAKAQAEVLRMLENARNPEEFFEADFEAVRSGIRTYEEQTP